MRPRLSVCMATSLDGRIADQAGGAPGFTSRYDRHKLFALRAQADVLLIGANTVRQELLPPLIRDEKLCRERQAAGLSPHPTIAIVSHSLNLPWKSTYFSQAQQDILVFTGGREEEVQLPDCAQKAAVKLIDTGAQFSLSKVLDLLGTQGFSSVLAEGGGKLHHSLLKENLVDCIFLTIAPVLIGGADVPGLVDGPRLQPLTQFKLSRHEVVGHELHLVYERGTSPEGKDHGHNQTSS